MVKQYGQLYLDTRHALLETEDAQTAGMMARQLLCHFSGKSPEAILADRAANGPYAAPEDLTRVKGISQRMVQQWGSDITVGG